MLARLRDAGADLDAVDADGFTPYGRARRALAAAQDRRSKGGGDETLATWLHRTLDELVACGAHEQSKLTTCESDANALYDPSQMEA